VSIVVILFPTNGSSVSLMLKFTENAENTLEKSIVVLLLKLNPLKIFGIALQQGLLKKCVEQKENYGNRKKSQ
jgi:hypothetical protein